MASGTWQEESYITINSLLEASCKTKKRFRKYGPDHGNFENVYKINFGPMFQNAEMLSKASTCLKCEVEPSISGV